MIEGLKLAMIQLKAAGSRTIYIDGSFVTREEKPKDFDACYDLETVDMNKLKQSFESEKVTIDRMQQSKPMSAILQRIRSRPRVDPSNFGLMDSTILIAEDRNR